RKKMVQDEISRRALLRSASLTLLSAAVAQPGLAADIDLPKDLDLEHFMRLAIVEAKKVPKFPFGSVIVNLKKKEVVATGTVRLNNPIWHGEMTAIYNCPDVDKGFNWKDVCLFTTGESCPMCQSAAIWCGMPYVIYGSSIPFLQSCGFGDINIRSKDVAAASLHNKCSVIGAVLESECNELFLNAKKLST
ncbi:MAG: nucleoside deaminase, partial [Candidatus Obscuribacterales bacterium]|nr:nucleoside deaminase [Candidatus Obscuribacterales bacterium]